MENSPSITTIILVKNHEDLIVSTLESVKDLGPILIADLGSTDKTVAICKEAGAKVFRAEAEYNYSTVRNSLIAKAETEWLFYLDPGEAIVSGQEFFQAEFEDTMYRVMVVKDDLLLKEPRLWKKGSGKFVRPVFESLEPDVSQQTLPIIISGETKPDLKRINDILLRWQDWEPLSSEPGYYAACVHLMNKQYQNFISQAEHYLFQKKTVDASTILTRYYIAQIVKKSNTGKALKLIMECIAAYPLMAEFWCLLGDLYLFFIREFDKAYMFYENALILGSQRLSEDTMPTEISKYDEYPKKMQETAKKAMALMESIRK